MSRSRTIFVHGYDIYTRNRILEAFPEADFHERIERSIGSFENVFELSLPRDQEKLNTIKKDSQARIKIYRRVGTQVHPHLVEDHAA